MRNTNIYIYGGIVGVKRIYKRRMEELMEEVGVKERRKLVRSRSVLDM